MIFLYGKKNIGYDFGSWCYGMFIAGAALEDLKELIFINDSNFGPVSDLSGLMEAIYAKKADVVGLTDSYEWNYHLQSYFLWFGESVLRSAALPLFCANYPFVSDKSAVIAKGELYITRMLQDYGFLVVCLMPYEEVAAKWLVKVDCLVKAINMLPDCYQHLDYRSASSSYKSHLINSLEAIVSNVISGIPLNPSHFFWDTLIEDFSFPFLKRELVMKNPCSVPSFFRISEVLSGYPLIHLQIIESRQRYGGILIPFLAKPQRDLL